MSTLSTVGKPSRDWLKVGPVPVADLIDQAWDALVELVDDGALTQSQLDHLYRLEDAAGDHPVARRLFLTTLRRALADPKMVSANPDALGAPFTCRCGPGRGMVEADSGWKPCRDCNPGGYRIWRDCYLTGCRGCATCRPEARRRGMQGDHRAERAEADADARAQRIKDDLR